MVTATFSAPRKSRAAARFEAVTFGLVLALILASGGMEATAIYNTASFGIPLFWATTGAAIGVCAYAFMRGDRKFGIDVRALGAAITLLAILWMITFIHVIAGRLDIAVAVPQLIARSALIGFFLVLTVYLQWRKHTEIGARILFWFFAFYIGYGLFDFLAQLMGWPGFFDFLRNSASITATEARGAQGWLRVPRVMTIASEPSMTTLAIAFALYLALFVWQRSWRTTLLFGLGLVFVVLTFSRAAWFSVAAALAAVMFGRLFIALGGRLARRFVLLGLAPVAILLPLIYLFSLGGVAGAFEDLSAEKRASTTLLGLRIFFDNPIFGIGLNNVPGYFWRHGEGLFDPFMTPSEFIHSGPALYLQAYGIFGLVVFITPIALILGLKALGELEKLWWVTVISIYGSTVDFQYLPQLWLILAFLVARNRMLGQVP